MVQTCHSPMKSPIEPISAVLDEIRDLAQEFVRFEFDELRSADKSLKGVLEREGGTLRTLYKERAHLRDRKNGLARASQCSDDEVNKLAKQLENLSAPSTGAIVDASQLRSQAAACESQMPGLREDLHEQQAELDRVTRVRDLTKRHLGLKISKEKNEAGLQILKFTFNNVAQSEPKQPFILKLAIEDSKFKLLETCPALPQTPQLRTHIDAANTDSHKLKALIRFVRREFSRLYSADKMMQQTAIMT